MHRGRSFLFAARTSEKFQTDLRVGRCVNLEALKAETLRTNVEKIRESTSGTISAVSRVKRCVLLEERDKGEYFCKAFVQSFCLHYSWGLLSHDVTSV